MGTMMVVDPQMGPRRERLGTMSYHGRKGDHRRGGSEAAEVIRSPQSRTRPAFWGAVKRADDRSRGSRAALLTGPDLGRWTGLMERTFRGSGRP